MRRMLATLSVALLAAPAFAEPTACRLVHTADVKVALGPVLSVKGEHASGCAGFCDSADRTVCHFAVDSATHTTVDVDLSLPSFTTPEADWRRSLSILLRGDHSVPLREIGGLGDAAFWRFERSRGYLAVFVAERYHLTIIVEGVASEDAARAASEALARAAIS